MQFKFDSTMELGDIVISLNNLKANQVIVNNFIGNEHKCAQCLRPIIDGDDVFVVQDTTFKNDAIILGSELQLVHIGGNYGSTCAEDYLSRMINKYAPIETPEVMPTEDASKSSQ